MSTRAGVLLGSAPFAAEDLETNWGPDVALRYQAQEKALQSEVLAARPDLARRLDEVAAAAVAVMLSTVVALLDVVPRVTASLIDRMQGRTEKAVTGYTALLAVQVVGVALIPLLLLQSFATFINFATSTAP